MRIIKAGDVVTCSAVGVNSAGRKASDKTQERIDILFFYDTDEQAKQCPEGADPVSITFPVGKDFPGAKVGDIRGLYPSREIKRIQTIDEFHAEITI